MMEENNQLEDPEKETQIATAEYEHAWDCLDREDYEGAIAWFEKAASAGIGEAYCELGSLYYYGLGVRKNRKKAFAYYKKGTNLGETNCLLNLSMCYFYGEGTQADLQKSAFYMEEAAKAGVAKAMFETALNYENGYGVPQNISNAIKWLEAAAEKNYPIAYTELANIYTTGKFVKKNLGKAIEYYRKGTEAGDIESKLRLAKCYEHGIATKKDPDMAEKLYSEAFSALYREAVINDNADAQFRLGTLLYSGLPLIDIPQDYAQAAEWYRKAAQSGHYYAQNHLGNMYAFGLGVSQSYEEAVRWYSLAAEKSDVSSLNNLGNFYLLGRGVKKDFVKAAKFHSKAAQRGYPNSQVELGKMYLDGRGVRQNPTQAIAWFEKAAEKGARDAFTHLGHCYMNGIGVEQDELKAFRNFQKAAQLGDLEGSINLAKCYIGGKGVQQDSQKAYDILKRLCDKGTKYKEEKVAIIEYTNDVEDLHIEDPLDSENLRHYASAFYWLATLAYQGKGTVRNPSEAIRLFRIADRLGNAHAPHNQESPEALIEKIKRETDENDIKHTTKSYVEIRKVPKDVLSDEYKLYIHHADGTDSLIDLKGRNKLVYVLGMLIAHEGHSVAGLTTRHFHVMRETLIELVKDLHIDKDDWERWIDEFIYVEKLENIHLRENRNGKTYGCFSLDRSKYSNALSAAKRAIKAAAINDEEFETFCLRAKGGKNSVALISADSSQIIIPPTLCKYLDELPTMDELERCTIPKTRFMMVKDPDK